MLKLSSLKADLQKEEEGDWVDAPDLPGVRLKVRSLEYKQYRIARDIKVQHLMRKYGRKPIPPDVQTKEYGKLYADHILLDWEGLAEDDGKPVAFTKELALELLRDPEFRKLTSAVEWAASQVAETEQEFLEASAKNSPAPSATI
jgi:hypothetical protein